MVKERNLTRWIFVLPAMIIVGLLFVYPFFSSIFYSFTNKHLIMPNYKFVGLANYKAVLSDPNFFNAFFNSIKWTVFSLVGQVLVGFVLALALHRVRHFKKLYRTLLIVPWAFPTIVIAFSWQWILNGVYGYLPNLIVKLGLMEHTPAFLTDSTWAFLCLVFINIWFGPANATTTLPIFAYNLGWGTKLLGRASAVTVLLFIFLVAICFIYFAIISKWEKEGRK
ncbi:TPA: carbohydrate ABC transporter permease [Streptococcus pneumoniae]